MENRVKERREELNMTQETLSELSKVSRQTISDLENKKISNVGSKIMTKLAIALNCFETDIFFTDNVSYTEQKQKE